MPLCIFEDDGLLRICHAYEDALIEFGRLEHSSNDASDLLIRTDFFD